MRYLRAPTELQWRCWRPYRAATATTLRFYCVFIRPWNQSAFYAAQSTCQRMAFLVTLRRKIKMHPYCFSWTQKNHLKTQPRCVRGLTCTQHIYNIYIHKFGGNFNSLKRNPTYTKLFAKSFKKKIFGQYTEQVRFVSSRMYVTILKLAVLGHLQNIWTIN